MSGIYGSSAIHIYIFCLVFILKGCYTEIPLLSITYGRGMGVWRYAAYVWGLW